MALSINGTTGISGVDGSASAPALQGTDSNTGINFASDTVNINTGGSTRATVDSSGRLLLGTTSASGVSSNADDLVIGSTSDSTARGLTLASTTNANIRFADGGDNATGMIEYNHSSNFMRFYVEAGELLRLDGGGVLTVTATNNTSAGLYLIADQGDDNGDGWRINSNQDANDLTLANNTSGSYADKLTLTKEGNISVSGSGLSDKDMNTWIKINPFVNEWINNRAKELSK